MRVSEALKGAVSVVVLFYCADWAGAEQAKRTSSARPPAVRGEVEHADIKRLRAEVIEKMKEARESATRLLALNEQEQQRLHLEYERRLEYFRQGLISRGEVIQAEHALARAILRVDQDRRWLTDTDIAITEATLRDELLRLPGLAVGGYSESPTLLRFNGAAAWTLADAPKIERFFHQAFGRSLPVSAWGQTPTHDRLRFDHRDAMDVALHPDSTEGRALIQFLRQADIPFVASRGVLPGASTGAHIHIGRPSVKSWTTVKTSAEK